jgi:hypothetical protein
MRVKRVMRTIRVLRVIGASPFIGNHKTQLFSKFNSDEK